MMQCESKKLNALVFAPVGSSESTQVISMSLLRSSTKDVRTDGGGGMYGPMRTKGGGLIFTVFLRTCFMDDPLHVCGYVLWYFSFPELC